MFVDTEDQVKQMLQCIAGIETRCSISSKPLLFIDLEGVNLSRHGSIAIMQICAPPMDTVYLLDVHVLKKKAFDTPGSDGTTLKTILESQQWAKVFFDVRNDSDALFSHFGVNLKSIIDIQILEFGTRQGSGRFVNGLARCIEYDLPMSYAERIRWQQSKNAGKQCFVPELGGAYEVFLQRPLPQSLLDYCTQDIVVMPRLLMLYGSKIRNNIRLAQSVHEEAINRVQQSQAPDYDGKGRHKAIGPYLRQQSVQALPFPVNVVYSAELATLCNVVAS